MYNVKQNVLIFVLLGVLAGAGLVLLWLDHPSNYGFMPRCPFHVLTGLYCPGCGSTRAVHHLLHGNLSASFRCNPCFMPLTFIVVLLSAKRMYEWYRNTAANFKYELLLYKLILFVVITFFIACNIPLASLEWLRPLDIHGTVSVWSRL